jgi:protein-tyrosine phosphatase
MPKVNPEIWSKLDCATRRCDSQLSSLQSALTKVGHITAQTTDTLLAARAEPSELNIDTLVLSCPNEDAMPYGLTSIANLAHCVRHTFL